MILNSQEKFFFWNAVIERVLRFPKYKKGGLKRPLSKSLDELIILIGNLTMPISNIAETFFCVNNKKEKWGSTLTFPYLRR